MMDFDTYLVVGEPGAKEKAQHIPRAAPDYRHFIRQSLPFQFHNICRGSFPVFSQKDFHPFLIHLTLYLLSKMQEIPFH